VPNYDRQFEEGAFFHIFNRGNHRQTVFFDDHDRLYFLKLVSDNSVKYGIQIVAHCLMRTHYHFAVHQLTGISRVDKWIGCSVMSYSHYFNDKYDQVGSLFQCRYKSKRVLTDAYLLHLTRYIHSNPSELCDPLQYRWSSIRSYLTGLPEVSNPEYVLNLLAGQSYARFMEVDVLSKSDFIVCK
jgi:putative transposase